MEAEGNAGSNNNSNQSAVNYMNRKGIHELFEAIMTALMIYKPDDHVSFIRQCLDKVQENPLHVRWDLFVTSNNNSISALSTTPLVTSRQEPLPPVRSGSTTTTTDLMNRKTSIKPMPLPPIEPVKTTPLHLPIIFILSKLGSTKLCSRLMERYRQVVYLSINDIAGIDDDDNESNSKQKQRRFDCVQRVFERHQSQARGFLLAGDVDEQNSIEAWKNKLGRVDLMFVILPGGKNQTTDQDPCLRSLDSTDDFDDLLAYAIRALDELFPQDSFTSERGMPVVLDRKASVKPVQKDPTVPIFFLIDNHELSGKANNHETVLPIDYELEILNNDNEDEENNSFVYTLCQRLAQQFSFKHISYENMNVQFDELKTTIIDSIGACSGYIIDHFPDSFEHLHRFESEIGPCSALIYIGDHQTVIKNDELNSIIEHFKQDTKAVYVDCRMEVDEIYEDLKRELLKHL